MHAILLAYIMIIVHAGTMIMIHACTMTYDHSASMYYDHSLCMYACAMIIIHERTITIEHVTRRIQVCSANLGRGVRGGDAPLGSNRLGERRPFNGSGNWLDIPRRISFQRQYADGGAID